jgi:hypothetical protein
MISQFGHRYKARISTELVYARSPSERQIQLFNHFMKNNCKIIKIKELKTRKNSYMKKYDITFEDGERGVSYSNVGEVMMLIPDIEFQMIEVVK